MKSLAAIILILPVCAFASSLPGYSTVITEPPPLTQESNAPTNTPDEMRAYLEVQSQLRATQLALERDRDEIAAQAARATREFNDRLGLLEQSNERELQMMQSNGRFILILAGACAGLGFIAMLVTTYLQWRGVQRMTEIILATREQSPLPGWQMPQASGEDQMTVEASSESTMRLLGLVERLEQRIMQLEQTTQSPVADASAQMETASPTQHSAPSDEDAANIALLLGKGESLLNLDKPHDAIGCFDEILGLDNNNAEALVKKGVALERLRKLNEAIECYDRAIAADGSMTIAYLYKGGVYNRLEKFDEALECYEQALRSQENGKSATN